MVDVKRVWGGGELVEVRAGKQRGQDGVGLWGGAGAGMSGGLLAPRVHARALSLRRPGKHVGLDARGLWSVDAPGTK